MNQVTTDVLVMIIIASMGVGAMGYAIITKVMEIRRNKRTEKKPGKDRVDFRLPRKPAEWEDNSE